MAPLRSGSARVQAGVSLIEILVGLGIGLVAVLAIFQTVAIWSRHTQTTSAGGDAQIAGTLALFALERDFRQSGHGFGEAPDPVMGCTVQGYDTRRATPAFNFPLRPVDIAVGAGGAPDTINVLSGNSSFFVEGQDFLSSTDTSKTLRRRGGFKQGDIALITDAGLGTPGSATCKLAEITADTDPDLLTVSHAPSGSYTPFYSSTPVPSHFDASQALPALYPYTAGTLYNLGPRPQLTTWQVVNNKALERRDFIFDPTLANQIADGVVNLKAQYGVDSDGDTRISDTEWVTALPVGTTWKQVLAVRVALLVRSRQFERTGDAGSTSALPVTTAAPTYFGGGSTFTMTNVNGAADSFTGAGFNTPDPNNWRFYRYRVYERVIPLKNMLWALP